MPPVGRSLLWRALEWLFPLSETAKRRRHYPPVDIYEVRIKGVPHVRRRGHTRRTALALAALVSHSSLSARVDAL